MTRIAVTPDLSFSRIAYGMWRIGEDDTSPAHVQAKIEACLEQGITTIDQADIYGGYTAEAVLGGCLRAAPALRERIEIITKCGIVAPVGRHAAARVKHYDTTPGHIEASVDHSLRAMAIERIDLLLIHRPDPFLGPDQTGATLDGLVAAGKVGAVGVSNFRPWDIALLQSRMEQPLVANQIEISLVAHQSLTNGDLAAIQERRMRPMAWSPLAGGTLFAQAPAALREALARIGAAQGVEASAVAVAWLLAHPAGILPVIGTNRLDRIGHLGEAMRVRLSRQDWFELYSLAMGHGVP